MTKDDIHLLYEYDRWANNRVLQAATVLSADQFTRDLGGAFCSVRDTLVHIIGGRADLACVLEGVVLQLLPCDRFANATRCAVQSACIPQRRCGSVKVDGSREGAG